MTLKFAGVRRKQEFSPNHIENDFRILSLTGDALCQLGAKVTLYDEATITEDGVKERLIFSMAQGPVGSAILMKIAERGALIINSPRSVMNCYRINMVRLLPGAGVKFPTSFLVNTADPCIPGEVDTFQGTWVKRGDVHAVTKEDVTLAYTREEILAILHRFHERGIDQAVVQEHIEGDVIKFYAVRDNAFFEWYCNNKFGLYPVDAAKLRTLAERSAKTMRLDIYGGDAIATPQGELVIIDINDWPSFAPFRERAAKHIAEAIIERAKEHGKFPD